MRLMRVLVTVVVGVNRSVRMPMFEGMGMTGVMGLRMGVRQFLVSMLVNVICRALRMIVCLYILVFDDDIDLGSSQPATTDLVHLKACTDIERRSRLFKQRKRHARIHKRAKQHVAADAGEAFQISDSHELKLYLCAAPHQHFCRQHCVQGPGTKSCGVECHVFKANLAKLC